MPNKEYHRAHRYTKESNIGVGRGLRFDMVCCRAIETG
eukprot:CAMPEP_0184335582 /NCGR_PEP_ID=MMETSP1089-20130417/4124_1 /TAXON_ID=38269 ORGANISM="Gloeochaete wittrockiana, Strain SAG46.84" /NCGR_SAMPLE_ID=MMETSP1089 /ASSEMBLY_ACC=CAM_ASM_000445 /LENGTH=37 /DNA_ID= /DNA_START= /DNA_END= /DNA_ORIENTATION=